MGTYTLKNFLDIKASHTATYSPVHDEVAFLDSATGTSQLYLSHADGTNVRQITDYADRLLFARFFPNSNRIIFGKDCDGNEHTQFHVYDVEKGTFQQLTDAPKVLHIFGGISEDERFLAYASNALNGKDFDIHIMDLETGDSRCVLKEMGWLGTFGFSPDGQYIAVSQNISNICNNLFLVDAASGEKTLVRSGDDDTYSGRVRWVSDSSAIYFVSNKDSDFKCLDYYDLTTKQIERKLDLGWGIQGVELSKDGSLLSLGVNEDGYDRFKLYQTSDMSPVSIEGMPDGMVSDVSWSRDSKRVLFNFADSTRTFSVWLWDRLEGCSWQVSPEYQDIPLEDMVSPELAHYKSFDGLEIPVFLYSPKNKSDKPLPVIVMIHGGPEGQFQPYFNPVIQYLVHSGYAVAGPNVRGSTGYGTAYTKLDDKGKRLDSVKDIVSLWNYLKERPEFDENKVVLTGGSYGGYMVLANLAFFPQYWAAGVDIVGISNLVTFLENTSVWRRALREAEYGSLEHDRDMLERVSPINKAEDITAPLMIIHGANDPRVPLSEAEQMYDTLKQLGRDVELLVYQDEGHGLAKRENRIDAWTKVVGFLDDRIR